MNSIKNTALIVLLAGAGYLAWQHFSGRAPLAPPPGVPQDSGDAPKVEIPGMPGTGFAGGGEAPRFVPGKAAPARPESLASKREPGPPLPLLPSGPEPANTPRPDPPGGPATALSAKAGSASGTAEPPRAEPPDRRPDTEIGEQFVKCMTAAGAALEQGLLTDVLTQLSEYYHHPDLTAAESKKLVELLDQLAGSVIYSREHRLEPPYRVRPGDTLDKIARAYGISPELLAKINGIRSPGDLERIEELKVVRGPFHAVVHLDEGEMTLMLERRDEEGKTHPVYAGRFRIKAGPDPSALVGDYEVHFKQARVRKTGPLFLELSKGVAIQGGEQPIDPPPQRGALQMGPQDMEDVYDILAVGSQVVIRR